MHGPVPADCPCEGNDGGRDQQPSGLSWFLQEVEERGGGARGVSALPSADPQGRALMRASGWTRRLLPDRINDGWGSKAEEKRQAPF